MQRIRAARWTKKAAREMEKRGAAVAAPSHPGCSRSLERQPIACPLTAQAWPATSFSVTKIAVTFLPSAAL